MANKIMKTLTMGENIYEIYDESARTDIATLQTETSQIQATIKNLPSIGGSGVTTGQANSLWNVLKKTAFVEPLTDEEITALKTEWGITEEEPDTPVEPDVPEVTLSSISATYSGGDVTVGTALTDLTGITVTGTYSDGSTSAITGYSLSGEILEGENTITVSYGGKTTTFTVTGVAEEADENNGWEADVAYELTWTDDYALDNSTGAETSSSGKSVSNYIPVFGASALIGNASIYGGYLYAYDSEKNYLGRVNYSSTLPCSINRNVAYIKVLATTANKTSVVIYPVVYDVLTENTAWESGKYYITTYNPLTSVKDSTGVVSSSTTWWASGYTFCYGATTLNIDLHYERRKIVVFYDADKNYISGSTGNNKTFEVPENAQYFIVSMYDGFEYTLQSANRPWVTLT